MNGIARWLVSLTLLVSALAAPGCFSISSHGTRSMSRLRFGPLPIVDFATEKATGKTRTIFFWDRWHYTAACLRMGNVSGAFSPIITDWRLMDEVVAKRCLRRGDVNLKSLTPDKSAFYYTAIVANPRIMASDGDIPIGHATIDIRHRKHAEDCLRRLGCNPADVYEQILAKEKDENLLLMAVKSLERVGRAESLKMLAPFQKHEKPAFRQAADRSVRRIRTRLELASRARSE